MVNQNSADHSTLKMPVPIRTDIPFMPTSLRIRHLRDKIPHRDALFPDDGGCRRTLPSAHQMQASAGRLREEHSSPGGFRIIDRGVASWHLVRRERDAEIPGTVFFSWPAERDIDHGWNIVDPGQGDSWVATREGSEK